MRLTRTQLAVLRYMEDGKPLSYSNKFRRFSYPIMDAQGDVVARQPVSPRTMKSLSVAGLVLVEAYLSSSGAAVLSEALAKERT